MGSQLARDQGAVEPTAAADLARRDRRRRRGAAGGRRALAGSKPARRARVVAAALPLRGSQRHLLDGADGNRALVAPRRRGLDDRLHDAGVGIAAGMADYFYFNRRVFFQNCGNFFYNTIRFLLNFCRIDIKQNPGC